MKRILSLLVLVAPAIAWTVEGGQAAIKGGTCECSVMDTVKSCVYGAPVSPRDEGWLARTGVEVLWNKVPSHLQKSDRRYDLAVLQTVQPVYRSDDLHNTVFGFAGVGTSRWDKASWNVGVGARYLTGCCGHLLGLGVDYHRVALRQTRFHGPSGYVEWLSRYTTLTLTRAWNRFHVKEHEARHFLKHSARGTGTSLDFSFQVPYLPWAKVLLGRTWFGERVGKHCFHAYRARWENTFRKLDYALRLNLLGCLFVEGGYLGGWRNSPYVRLVLNLGRPACREFALTDGCVGGEAFTPRDLKCCTLTPAARERLGAIAQLK